MNYIMNFGKSAVGRYFGVHQYYLLYFYALLIMNRRHVPSATITAITKPATLQQRTNQGREAHILSIYSSLKKTIEIAASAEERIQQNDNMYLPLFSSPARFVYKLDIILPCLFIIIAIGLLLFSYVSISMLASPLGSAPHTRQNKSLLLFINAGCSGLLPPSRTVKSGRSDKM